MSMAVTETSHVAARQLDDLYRRHGGEVYRYALAVLGNNADAEDVTQTTFLNAYRALEQGVRPRKPANWLLTIASNAIKQRFRHDQSRPREVALDTDVAVDGGEVDGPSVGELLTALSKIPPQQRQAIVLREFEGRSYNEIAQILEVTTSALETLLFRARRSLAEELTHSLTCTDAQQAISRAADGRLGRKERRRLQEHLTECPDCAQFARLQQRHRKALRGLALIPIPVSLALFKGLDGTAAAATLPVASGAVAAGGGAAGVGTGLGGAATASGGGVFAGGLALKAAAVVAAAGVAGGATVVGAKEMGIVGGKHAPPPTVTTNRSGTGVGEVRSQRAAHASQRGLERGKAVARGQTGNLPPGQLHRQQKTKGASADARAKARNDAARAEHPKKAVTHEKPVKEPAKKGASNGSSTGRSDQTGKQSASSPQAPTSTQPAPETTTAESETPSTSAESPRGSSGDHSNKP